MTWFKVDDSFYDHPKVFDAPDCALSLWTRAGSWAARNLTDGFVPSGMPARLCDDPERAIRELINRGLWTRTKGGYQFHDWSDYQPMRSEAMAERVAKASGGTLGNHRRWHEKKGITKADCAHCQAKQDRTPDRISDRYSESDSESSRPDPTRTDLSTTGGTTTHGRTTQGEGRAKRARTKTKIPSDFTISAEMVAWARTECPHVDGRRATAAFIDHFTGTGDTKADWVATWRNWMRRDQADAERRRSRAAPSNVIAIAGQRPKSPGEANIDDWMSMQMPTTEAFR